MRMGLLGVAVMVLASCAGVPAGDPATVVIVIERDPVVKGTAVVEVTDREETRRMEGFFPNYTSRPEAREAGAWDAKYEVTFHFAEGKEVRVTLPDDGKMWSCGNGDFSTKGDFVGFVEGLGGARKKAK